MEFQHYIRASKSLRKVCQVMSIIITQLFAKGIWTSFITVLQTWLLTRDKCFVGVLFNQGYIFSSRNFWSSSYLDYTTFFLSRCKFIRVRFLYSTIRCSYMTDPQNTYTTPVPRWVSGGYIFICAIIVIVSSLKLSKCLEY